MENLKSKKYVVETRCDLLKVSGDKIWKLKSDDCSCEEIEYFDLKEEAIKFIEDNRYSLIDVDKSKFCEFDITYAVIAEKCDNDFAYDICECFYPSIKIEIFNDAYFGSYSFKVCGDDKFNYYDLDKLDESLSSFAYLDTVVYFLKENFYNFDETEFFSTGFYEIAGEDDKDDVSYTLSLKLEDQVIWNYDIIGEASPR